MGNLGMWIPLFRLTGPFDLERNNFIACALQLVGGFRFHRIPPFTSCFNSVVGERDGQNFWDIAGAL